MLSGNWLAFQVEERIEGTDLNGDDDTDDSVFHVYDIDRGETTNLGLAGAGRRVFSGDWLLFQVFERARGGQGEDLNGDGDTLDGVFHLVDLQTLVPPTRFLRGDCNDDGAVDISDAVFILGVLFLGEGDSGCDDACDSNDDGAVDISDAIATLGVLFLGSGSIPLPGMRECGVDPTEGEVGCETFDRCP